MKKHPLSLSALVPNTWLKWLSMLLMASVLSGCQLPFMSKPAEPAESKEKIVTAKVKDSGFGGTGQVAATKKVKTDKTKLAKVGGSGFGGTGIVGTITKFGSVWVNGIEVEYPSNVTIKSNLLNNETLKIGQRVIVETVIDKNLPWAEKIEIFYPLAGKIEVVKNDHIMVDGKIVFITKNTRIPKEVKLKRGQYVAVNGYPNIDKSWNATLISPNPAKKHLCQKLPKVSFSKNLKKLSIQTTAAELNEWDQQFEGLPLNFIQTGDGVTQRLLLKAEVKKGKITRYQLQKLDQLNVSKK